MDDSYANELLVVAEYTSSADSTVSKVMLVSLIAQSNVDGPFSINGSLLRLAFASCLQ